VHFFEETHQQQTVAQGVDLARNAAGVGEDGVMGAVREGRVALPADRAQAVFDVELGFLAIHRSQVVAGDHALAQLLHAGAVQGGAKFRLADQEGLQQALVVGLEIRQHAQLLDRARFQVLGFIDHQQRALALLVGRAQELLEAGQQVGLADVFVGQAEGRTTMRRVSSESRWVLTIWAATICSDGSLLNRLRTSVVLPAPTSPVMTMKPSPCDRPYSR
jgi:hypothetical protein